ncbi:hypothetical protein EDB84DRAFT_1485924 [Lactarius hengduanensis]|nr:hypothetical protein EDB84DRAFT_1485924 [Lactarius hengduanensis]
MEYIDDSTYLRPDLIIISPLCWFFSLKAYIELDSDPALSGADKGVEASRASLDANSKVILAGALPTNLRFYRSRDRNNSAYAISAEVVTLFRSASVDRPVFSFWSMPFPSVLTDSRRRIARTSHSTIFESGRICNPSLLSQRNGNGPGHFTNWRSSVAKVRTSERSGTSSRLHSLRSAHSARSLPWIMLVLRMVYIYMRTGCWS